MARREREEKRSRRDDDEPRKSKSSKSSKRGDSERRGNKKSKRDDDDGEIAKTGRLNLNKALSDYDETYEEGGGGQRDYWSPRNGANSVRVGPPVSGSEDAFARCRVHESGNGTKQYRSWPCPRWFKLKCRPCDEREKLEKSKSKADQESSKSLRTKLKVVCNIVDQDEPEKGSQLWTFGKTIDDAINKWLRNPKIGDITDKRRGRAFSFDKSGSGLETDYSGFALEGDATVFKKSWYDGMVDMSDYWKKPTKEDIAKMDEAVLGRRASRSRDDDDEDEKPRKRSRRDDDDEKPRKSASSRKSKKRRDDDDDDKPARKAKRRAADDYDDEDD